MPIIKDANYWKEYNQKRREYLLQKKRESRAKLKDLVVDQPLNKLVVDISQVVDQKEIVVDGLQPETNLNEVVESMVVDIESYNQEVYNRARTKDPRRFFTFADGRKIVRTRCGCNPTEDFYDWCLDNCKYFAWWRNKQ